MNKIIGYKQALALMKEGYQVKECPQIRGGSIPYLYSPEGITCYRLREDTWRKLQMKCRFVKRETFGKRGRNAIYIWAYRGSEDE